MFCCSVRDPCVDSTRDSALTVDVVLRYLYLPSLSFCTEVIGSAVGSDVQGVLYIADELLDLSLYTL